MTYLAPPGAALTFVSTLCRPISPLDDLRSLFQLWRLMRQFEPDIIHTHMAKAGLIGRSAALAFNFGRRRKARVIHTYHGHVLEGYFSAAKTAVFINLERMLARWSDAHRRNLAGDSTRAASRVIASGAPGNIASCRWVSTSRHSRASTMRLALAARQSLGIDARARVVTTVGRLTAIKQHGLFLETFARVAAYRSRCNRADRRRRRAARRDRCEGRRASASAIDSGCSDGGATWRPSMPRPMCSC